MVIIDGDTDKNLKTIHAIISIQLLKLFVPQTVLPLVKVPRNEGLERKSVLTKLESKLTTHS
jgi:hypothetical protein